MLDEALAHGGVVGGGGAFLNCVDAVLAATSDGVYRSPNGSRAWRMGEGAEAIGIADMALAGGQICVLLNER